MKSDIEGVRKYYNSFISANMSIRATNLRIIPGILLCGLGFLLLLQNDREIQTVLVVAAVEIASVVLVLWGLIECIEPNKHKLSHFLYISACCLLLSFGSLCFAVDFFVTEWHQDKQIVVLYMTFLYPVFYFFVFWSTRNRFNKVLKGMEINIKKFSWKVFLLTPFIFVGVITSIEMLLGYFFPDIEYNTISYTPALAIVPYLLFSAAVGCGRMYCFFKKYSQFLNEGDPQV